MSTQNDEQQGLVLGVVFGLIVLVIGLVFGIVLSGTGSNAVPAAAAMPNASAAMASAADAPRIDGPSVQVEGEVVKFYFVSGKADLPAGAPDALGTIVKGVAAGQTAVVSGYHDTTGDAASNEALAKQRAQAVQAALQALGIGADKIELRKPDALAASGSAAEARRVEVTLQ